MSKGYERHGAAVIRSARWKALRQVALRRDGFRCVDCGAHGRLEVHHVKRVRDYPALAFDLDNLKSLCGSCHAKITRIETGIAPDHPERAAWRAFVRALAQPQPASADAGIPREGLHNVAIG